MSLWNGATTVVFERSSDGNTAQVLGDGDAVIATCDDAGNVHGPDGTAVMTAPLIMPDGARQDRVGADVKRLGVRVEVAAPDGTAAGAVGVRKFSVGPFSKKLTLVLRDPDGGDVGELSTTDKKGRELAVDVGGQTVASMKQVERDRGIRRTVERWSIDVAGDPGGTAGLLAAAAILRHQKLLAEVSAPGAH